VNKPKSLDIFNYEFDWNPSIKTKLKADPKSDCCKKYKKKGENKCKNCPKRSL